MSEGHDEAFASFRAMCHHVFISNKHWSAFPFPVCHGMGCESILTFGVKENKCSEGGDGRVGTGEAAFYSLPTDEYFAVCF